jgi:ribosomal-protein-alanine N-acetyltransferase
VTADFLDELTLRAMEERDLDAIVELEKLSFPTPWSRQSFESELFRNSHARYAVAEYQRCVIGYGGMWLVCDETHVTNIAVHPTFRGRGVGRLLLRTMMLTATMLGATRMLLEVRPSNRVAQKLYFAHGFRPVGVRPKYYSNDGEDALILQCDQMEVTGAADSWN